MKLRNFIYLFIAGIISGLFFSSAYAIAPDKTAGNSNMIAKTGFTKTGTDSAVKMEALKNQVKTKLKEKQMEMEQNRLELKEKFSTKAAEMKQKLTKRAILLQASVTSVDTDRISVEKDGITTVVLIGTDTRIVRRFFGTSTLAEIKTGHVVMVYGTWTDDTKTTIDATLIRDASIQLRYGVFVGTVTSISGTNLTFNSVNRSTQVADLSGTPVIVNRRMEKITLTDVKVGHRIRVKGMWDRSVNTITDVIQLKDYTLPAIQVTPRTGTDSAGLSNP